jgi:DNA invertase Pin-like site-specific DNA recombinase
LLSFFSVRPRRDELLRAVRRQEIDLVLIWRLDHWGRSLIDLINSLQKPTA